VFFEIAGPGTIRVTFDEIEVELLRQIPAELEAIYQGTDPEPARERLFPRPYLDPTEEDAEEQWNALVVPELLRERLEGLNAVLATLDGGNVIRTTSDREQTEVVLGPEELNLWLGVLNDARLTLGSRLEVTDDTNHREQWELAPDDPETPARAAYLWLTTLQELLVETMMETLPD
jgi:Domain of unknown function (DUF2017)